MSDVHALTELQISLLRVLWERGEGSAQDVHEALAGERDLALTTVATLLARLERRGIVRHRREGRRFIYRACVSEREVRRSKLREITETLFDGDPAALLSHLVRSGEVDASDLERMRELVDGAEEET